MVRYKVEANITGKRIKTRVVFKSWGEAHAYAQETNRYYPQAKAKVVEVVKKKK